MESAPVTLTSVSLSYFTEKEETPAIRDLNMQVKKGEFVAIVGPSGCGKTSVLSLIMGLMQPQEGVVDIDRQKIRIGYMLQRDHLLEWRTVEKNVLLGLEVQHRKTKETVEKASQLLKEYGLWDFARYYPNQLSGGMRQKVALIRTLATEPELLLLDEPFSALDYQTRLTLCDEVYRIIRNEKKTAILVTHDISEAVSMADRILVFSKRPSRVKAEIENDFSPDMPPLVRRRQPSFQRRFEQIWEELEP